MTGIISMAGTTDAAIVNAQVDAALNTAIPASPTAISINALVKGQLAYLAPITSSADTTHFVSSVMIGYGNDYFVGWAVYVTWDAGGSSAAPQGEYRIVSDYVSATGTFTISVASTQLAATDVVMLVHPLLLAIKTQTDKLAVSAAVAGSTTANWNTATGASGEAGEDLVTIGANDTFYELGSLLLNVSACTDTAVLTVKMFTQINGVEAKVYSQSFVVNTDPDGLWIVQGKLFIHEALRVEVYSATNESVAIAYDYTLRAL